MRISRTTRFSHLRNIVYSFAGALLLQTAVASGADSLHLVRNINTTLIPQSSYPTALGSLGGRFLFGAADATGAGLWSTDGTTAGTKLVQRLSGLGIVGNSPGNNFFSTGSRAYFVTSDTTGSSLWITDGTSAGTIRVISLPSGTTATASILGLFNSMVVFSSTDANLNGQMFMTDGTAAGTHQLTSFTGANEAGVLNGFVVAGSKFYFVAMNSSYSRQIWVSDGTAAGTRQVTNGSGTYGAVYNPQDFQLVGNLVIYESNALLWSIDTTSDTIANVVATNGTPGFGPPTVASQTLANMGGFVLFLANQGIGASNDLQLWRSDGTMAGTYDVADVTANPTTSELQYPVFEQAGGKVFYIGDDGVNGPQLWSSDGTSADTIRLTSASANPQDPAQVAAPSIVIGGTAYFTISDGAAATTRSFWRTDGTVPGTERLGGLPSVSIAEAGVSPLSGDAGTVYIGITDTTGSTSLYKYIPASNTSTLVQTGPELSTTQEFFELGGMLFFSQSEPTTGVEPWVSDGTAAGTHLIEDINPQVADYGSLPDEFVNFGGRLAFVADDGIAGRELWISDGTTAGTKLLADINPGSASSNPNHLFVLNGVLYFFATDASGHSKLMSLATAGAAPQVIATLSPQPTAPYAACDNDATVAIGRQMFFAADDGTTGLEPWTSDGTAAGTHLTVDIAPGIAGSNPCYLTVLGGKVYFSATAALGNELWSSDGSASGTVQVADIAPGAASSFPAALAVFNAALYFAADDTVHGSELWSSNGTASGTALVADLIPGPAGSFPSPIGTLNGKLLIEAFTASGAAYTSQFWVTDGTTQGTTPVGTYTFPPAVGPLINGDLVFFAGQDAAGVEPWVSDGTAGGTRLLKDINPNGSSNPSWFENFLGATLFEVTDPTLGEQLWRSDGTTSGTTLVSSIPALDPNPSAVTSAVHRLAVGNTFYIAANDPTDGTELYALTHAAPIAAADSASSTNDSAVTIDVLANDSAPDGTLNPASIVITTNPAHGTAAVDAGKVLYTPAANFAGTDTFSYTVSDYQGASSAPAIVTMTVTASTVSPSPPSSGGGGGGSLNWLALFGLTGFWCLRLSTRRAIP